MFYINMPLLILAAYLHQAKEEIPNVIIIDWSDIASNPFYPQVVRSTEYVGNTTAQLIRLLSEEGIVLDLGMVHIIGHSLGAHVAGFAGAELGRTIGKVGRITG